MMVEYRKCYMKGLCCQQYNIQHRIHNKHDKQEMEEMEEMEGVTD